MITRFWHRYRGDPTNTRIAKEDAISKLPERTFFPPVPTVRNLITYAIRFLSVSLFLFFPNSLTTRKEKRRKWERKIKYISL